MKMDLSDCLWHHDFSYQQIDAVSKKIETLFAPVWELDLSEDVQQFLTDAEIFLVIQLCRIPKLRGADPACRDAIRQALKKRGLDFGMKAQLVSGSWFPRDLFRWSDPDELFDKHIDILVRYYSSICREEARLDPPELSGEEKQKLRQRVREDSRKGFTFSPSGRSLLDTPLAWDEEEYTIPYGVIMIDSKAFLDQTSLKRLVIPDTIMKIDESAFNGCLELTEIEVSARDFELSTSAFDQVPGRKFLPPALQEHLKNAMDVPDRGWKTYRAGVILSSDPAKAVHHASDLLRKLDQFSDLPDSVPPRTELDRRLNILLSVPVPEENKIWEIGRAHV